MLRLHLKLSPLQATYLLHFLWTDGCQKSSLAALRQGEYKYGRWRDSIESSGWKGF